MNPYPYINPFPTSLATGDAFCNRQNETKKMLYNLEHNIPTLIMSSRRYGKTSLALRSLELFDKPYAHIDLYKAMDEQDIVNLILEGIGRLLGLIETAPKRLIKLAADFFSSFHVTFALHGTEITVEYGQKTQKSAGIILSALEKLDDLAKKRNKKVVLFLDEFQSLAEISMHKALEAAIREAIQKSRYVTYIFSGSNRHLIEEIFKEKARPLYKLCDTIYLSRIDRKYYEAYIDNEANKKWGKSLSTDTLDTIFATTKLHPYYVNKLCSIIWQYGEFPSVPLIENCWQQYVVENKSAIERELALLPHNQKKLLILTAKEEYVEKPFSLTWARKWNMSTATIQSAMTGLVEKDYVHVVDNTLYAVLDPLIESLLKS